MPRSTVPREDFWSKTRRDEVCPKEMRCEREDQSAVPHVRVIRKYTAFSTRS